MKNPEKTNNNPPVNASVAGKVPSSENIQELYAYVQSSLTFIETKNGVVVALLGGLIAAILSFSMERGNNLWLYLSIIPIARKYRLSRIAIKLLFGSYIAYAIILAIAKLICT